MISTTNTQLRDAIRKQFRTQGDFSMRVREDETVISRVIHGRRQLNQDRQKVWADLLGCKVCDIFQSESGVCDVR